MNSDKKNIFHIANSDKNQVFLLRAFTEKALHLR